MNHSLRKTLCLLAVAAASLGPGPTIARAAAYTYPDLVRRLTDLDRLAETPAPGEKTALASSYDRNSQYDAVHDKYIRWDANGDDYGVVRMEGNQAVFADIQGPGCLCRIWSAKAQEGHVKIYLDGSATPTVDLPFRAYFDGSAKPFDRPEIVYKTTPGKQVGGLNNFTPISFQKSCKIVADPAWGAYYQIDYTTFPPGTVVPTFRMDLSPEDSAALDRANQILSRRGESPAGARPGEKTDRQTIQAVPSVPAAVTQLTGPEAVTALRVKLDLPADPEAARVLLRQLVLQITWDGGQNPAVWCPLGDFFACFGGGKPFRSLPVGLSNDGWFYSYWYMPFANHAKIEVVNDGPAAVAMRWEVSHAPLARPAAGFDRFHAKWHRDAFLTDRADRKTDWNMLTTQGAGRYVGTQLHVWNPRGGWWGEGDDKFFVDGEKFPSLFGTGSEDYFGAAYGLGRFDRAFHGVVDADPSGVHDVVHRWHIADSVPFQTSFEADIEKEFSNDRPASYDVVAFWYLDPTGVDPYPAVPVADRMGYWPAPPVRHEPDAIEGEALPILAQDEPKLARHRGAASDAFPVNTISGDQYLGWRGLAAGQKLKLGLHVAKAGKYRLSASFLRRRSGGIFQMSLDDQPLGAAMDFYGLPEHGKPNAILMDPIDLGTCDLTAGDHVLAVEYLGRNDAADKGRDGGDIGLDYLKLVPAP